MKKKDKEKEGGKVLEEKRQEEGIKNQKERREKKCIEEGEGDQECE